MTGFCPSFFIATETLKVFAGALKSFSVLSVYPCSNDFSPARIGTFTRFSAGVMGQDHISL